FQRREWRAQRIGWALLVAFVLAGLLGVLGTGPLSWATAGTGPVTVRYDRVIHHEADETIRLTFAPQAVRAGTVTVEVTGPWTSAMDISDIHPQPSGATVIPGGVTWEFDAERGDLEVSLGYRAGAYGLRSGEVAVGHTTVEFAQLVLP